MKTILKTKGAVEIEFADALALLNYTTFGR